MKTDWNPLLYSSKHSFVFEYGNDLITLLNPQKEERILDVGCGSGQLTHQIAQAGASVVGIDSSPQMIKEATSSFPGIEFRVMDAANFCFNQPFDAVFSNAALHWVLNKEGAAACMHQSLKPGGRLILEMGGKDNIHTILTSLRTALSHYGLKQNAAKEVWYFPSVGEYTWLLEKQGFRVTLAQHFDRPTELADAEHGIEEWLEMFASDFFEGMNNEQKAMIKKEVQQNVKEKLFYNHKWHADYKRLRVVALKP